MTNRTISFILSVSSFLTNQLYAQNNNSDIELNIKEQPTYYNLNKALRNKENVYKLNLAQKNLKKFPVEIFELKKLRHLILDSNQITTIPKAINLLKKLEVFSIARNNIQYIPPLIGELENLSYLYVDFNRLIDLPPELFHLYNLKVLYVNNNDLRELPVDFMKLKGLQILVASNNKFENIPNGIGHLYSLKKLSLSNNSIKELPDKFFELSSLKFLYLQRNQLIEIDDDIEKLTKLEVLNLSENKIKKLSSKIGELHQLEKLYVDNNEIELFPLEINNFINLSILSIDNNPIGTLPEGLVNLKKLESLSIKGVILNPFPQVLYDLQNNGIKIYGLTTKELYEVKLLLSQARNKKLIGNYNEAIEKYNKIIQLDTNNVQAMYGLASSFLENGDFDLAKETCEKALTKNPSNELIQKINLTYDNSLVESNLTTRLINKHENEPPNFALGKYYYDLERYDTAIVYFQKSIKLNPSYTDSHFYLAIASLIKEEKIPFIFSTLRYLTLELNGKKAKTILPFLFYRMNMETGVEGKKGNISYYDSYIIRDDDDEIIYKSESPQADLLGAMLLGISRSNIISDDTLENDTIIKKLVQTVLHTNETNLEIFQYKLNLICKSDSNEIEKFDSFSKDYYLPYYRDLITNGHLETFSYIINDIRQRSLNSISASQENNFAVWLKDNSAKLDEFNMWSKNYKWKSSLE